MVILILGLVLFLGVHSVRIVANDWRTAKRAQLGEAKWKAAYSLLSLLGLILIVWGFGQARQQPVVLWTPPLAMRHIAGLLTALAFILLTAKDIPRNGIKARVHHPMLLGVKVWALAHLLANGKLHDVVLFASFLAWAILCFRAARRRDVAEGIIYPTGTTSATVTTVVAGLAGWAVFAFVLHGWLIGVRPY